MKRLHQVTVSALALLALSCSNGSAGNTQPAHSSTTNSVVSVAAIPLAGRVTDAAHVLSDHQEKQLTAKLEKLEAATHHQMVVVTVPSLNGRDVADYARDLSNSWGIGRKGYDDGVMILVAPKEHLVRIAVGYGLETRLTHILCQKIINVEMLPRFRQGDLPGGIEAGTDALIANLS